MLLAIAKCFLLTSGRLLIDPEQRDLLVRSQSMTPQRSVPMYTGAVRSKVPVKAPGRLQYNLENQEMHRQLKEIHMFPMLVIIIECIEHTYNNLLGAVNKISSST